METTEIVEPASPDSASTSASGFSSGVTSSPPRRAPDMAPVPKMKKKKGKKSKVDGPNTGTPERRMSKHERKMAALRLKFEELTREKAVTKALIAQRDREVAAAEQKLHAQRLLNMTVAGLSMMVDKIKQHSDAVVAMADPSRGPIQFRLGPGFFPPPSEPEDPNGTK